MAVNTFEKGMSNEFSLLKQGKGTYNYARNMIRDAQGTIKSEPGTSPVVDFTVDVTDSGSTFTLPGAHVIGQTTVDNLIFYFIKSNRGSSIVQVDVKAKIAVLILHTGEVAEGGGEPEV